MLQCIAVCGVVCCSVCCSGLRHLLLLTPHLSCGIEAFNTGRSVLQCVAVCCSVLYSVFRRFLLLHYSTFILGVSKPPMLECVALRCSVLQCVLQCVVQCVAVLPSSHPAPVVENRDLLHW